MRELNLHFMTENTHPVSIKVLASKEKRFINMLIDVFAYQGLSFVAGVILGVLSLIGIEDPLNYFLSMGTIGELVFGIVIVMGYFIIFEAITQRTLGKYVTKTIVLMEDGSKPKTQDIIIRSLCRLIPFEAFSFLGETGRGWHDSMSDTYVVDIQKYEQSKIAESEIDLIGRSQETV